VSGCARPAADIPVRKRTVKWAASLRTISLKIAEFRHFRHLARLLLNSRHQGNSRSGSMKMAKVEALAFTVGFFMTGLITFVALPLAA
jgi:exopolyphosphatase/pppGpp-phosphohydrolase